MPVQSLITQRLLDRAALMPGMRVLDVGCGAGDITRAVAQRVGRSGHVTGVDSNAGALSMAVDASKAAGLDNIDYRCCDLSALDFTSGTFDALVGRRVLMYVRDVEPVITALVDLLRVDGVMAFQEHDRTMTPGRLGHWPLHDQVHGWMWQTVVSEGANPNFGMALPGLLAKAGMVVESVTADGIVSGYEQGLHHPLHWIIQAMLPRIVAHGVATEEEIDVPTLEARMRTEREVNASVYVSDMAFSVVARKANHHEPSPLLS